MGIHETLKALSDPVRRNILELLKEGRLSAGDIAKQFDLSAATISHHLSQLKKSRAYRGNEIQEFYLL